MSTGEHHGPDRRASLFVLHGLSIFGFAKAFGYADLPLLDHAISEPIGVLWLTAGLPCLASAAALFLAPRWWWVVGALAVVTSKVVIVTSALYRQSGTSTLTPGICAARAAP